MTTYPDLERHRPRLFGLAYRMLGDVGEAEDVVQETFLRWHQGERSDVASVEGWLVAVASRIAVDRLRQASTARLTYVGEWLPEPVATDGAAPDRGAELASDLSMALLVLLERLAPEERAAFLLREVFDVGYDEIARILARGEPAVRQMVHRARERVRTPRARVAVPADAQARLLDRFLDALATDDHEAMLALFAEDATFTSDGGGRVRAARRVILGPDRITRFLLGYQRKAEGRLTHRVVTLNGEPAIAGYVDGQLFATTAFATDGERIVAAWRVLNPEKLRRLVGRLSSA